MIGIRKRSCFARKRGRRLRAHDGIAVRERIQVGDVVARDDRRPGPGDPLQVLVREPEPEPERRQRHRLRHVVPGFRGTPPSIGGREGTAGARLGCGPVRAIALPVEVTRPREVPAVPAPRPARAGGARPRDVRRRARRDARRRRLGDVGRLGRTRASSRSPLGRGAQAISELRPDPALGDPPDRSGGGGPDDGGARDPARGHAPRHARSALRAALHTLGPVVRRAVRRRAGHEPAAPPPAADAIPSRFGPDSFRRHLETAAERGLPTAVVER